MIPYRALVRDSRWRILDGDFSYEATAAGSEIEFDYAGKERRPAVWKPLLSPQRADVAVADEQERTDGTARQKAGTALAVAVLRPLLGRDARGCP